jgi:hypothetical protein
VADAGAGAAGAMAYKMDKNAFVREYRSFLEQQQGKPISDEEFAQYKSGQVADMLSEHGYHEAGWEGIFTAIEQGTLARLGGGLTTKALKGLASLALFEIGSEAGTQIGQTNVEAKLGMRPEEDMRSYLEPKDWLKSAREVLPAVLVMSGTMASVQTAAGAVGDKIHEGRVNQLRDENLGLPTLDALANDPAALKARGLVQADVIPIMREKTRQSVIQDLRERGYTVKELEEIKKDKELLNATGVTEDDIAVMQEEAKREVEISKQAAVVDPQQEKLKKLNNKVANLESLPDKENPEVQAKIEEVKQERDALVAAGVQEPEGLYRMGRAEDIIKKRETLLSPPPGTAPDMDRVKETQDDLESYLSRVATGQQKADENTVSAIDALVSRPELASKYAIADAIDVAKKLGRDTKDIESLKPAEQARPPVKFTHATIARSYFFDAGAGAMQSTGYLFNALAGSFLKAVNSLSDVFQAHEGTISETNDDIRTLIDSDKWTRIKEDIISAIESSYGTNAAEARSILDEMLASPTGVSVRQGRRLEMRLEALSEEASTEVSDEMTTEAPIETTGGKTAEKVAPTNQPEEQNDPLRILSERGGLKAMRGMGKEPSKLRMELRTALGTKNSDHATIVKALMDKTGVKNPAALEKMITEYKPPTLPKEQRTQDTAGEVAPTGQGQPKAEPVEVVNLEPVPKTELELIEAETDNLVARGKLVELRDKSVGDKAQSDVIEQKIKEVDTMIADSMRGKTIKLDVVAEGTKQVSSIEVDASEAYMENREQDELCKELLNCLGA